MADVFPARTRQESLDASDASDDVVDDDDDEEEVPAEAEPSSPLGGSSVVLLLKALLFLPKLQAPAPANAKLRLEGLTLANAGNSCTSKCWKLLHLQMLGALYLQMLETPAPANSEPGGTNASECWRLQHQQNAGNSCTSKC